MSLVRPKVQTSVHYCENTKKGLIKEYQDNTDISSLAEGNIGQDSNAYPTVDNQDNPLSTEYGYCVYKDSQTIVLQEMPERAPPGQLPRSIQVILENDLVDKVKPGDRVEITGVFKAKNQSMAYNKNAVFQTVLIATGVQNIAMDKEKPVMSEMDIRNIRKLSKEEKVFDILGGSIGSSIEGHLNVKKALLLMLLGGAEKNLETGTHLRGDINIMMVGDPSTAKSQLLRHIMDIAPLAINTTGRGSSGVGLTAAVTVDRDTGERHLEAGAMVLADKGIVCIDEFDKMNDQDKVAIHEVMEQQTVTIAKAGIHVSLNARCSVIAAANPMYGEYARDMSVATNIGLPDSLLSRFDLLFVMLDDRDAESDRRIAERVINNHRYQTSKPELLNHFNYQNDDVIIEENLHDLKNSEGDKGTMVLEKTVTTAATNSRTRRGVNKEVKQEEILEGSTVTREFLKKYILFAKSQKQPEISQDCIEYAAQYYAVLRSKAKGYDKNCVSVPITVRTLETMIRLATAHAKLKLAKSVEPSDIDIAATLLNMCIFQQTTNNNIKDEEYGEDEDVEMFDEEDEEVIKVHTTKSRAERMADKEMKNESPHTKSSTVQKIDIIQEESKSQRKTRATNGTVEKSVEKSTGKENKKVDINVEKKKSQQHQTPQKSSNKKVTFSEKKSLTESAEQPKSNKKLKIDHDEQVRQLLQSKPVETFSLFQKKFVFKLIMDIKDKQNKSSIDLVWKKYFTMPEKQTMQTGSTEPMISNKNQLVAMIEELERENLVMYTPEDGTVILI